MANNPKKIKDPTDTAVAAIQEVFHSADEQQERKPAADAAGGREGRRGRVTAPPESSLFDEDDVSHRLERPAANDDRQSIGQILQTLQKRPAKTSYLIATLFAFAWLVGGLVLAFLYMPDLRAALQGGSRIPAIV